MLLDLSIDRVIQPGDDTLLRAIVERTLRIDTATNTYPLEALTDLKRHDMGSHLCDLKPQPAITGSFTPAALPADSMANPGMVVPVGVCEFLTPPLWGISGTGPYMHDGRSITLVDAIPQHCGDGEGNDACVGFTNLAEGDQDSLVAFLLNQFFE